MNGAHIHLIINHAPIFGAIFVTALMAIGLMRHSQEMIRISIWLLLAVIAVGAATFLTGEGAEEVVKRLPEFNEDLVEAHERLGTITVITAAALGVFAAVVLVRTRGREISRGLATAVFIGALAACGLLAFTSMAGGRIRHPEVRPDFVVPADVPK